MELQLGVSQGARQVLDTIRQRATHDELLFNTASAYGGLAGGLFNRILDICSQSTEKRGRLGAWYEAFKEFQQQLDHLGPASDLQIPSGVENKFDLRPMNHRGLEDVLNAAEIIMKMREVKALIDLAYGAHAALVQEKVDEEMQSLFDGDDELEPFPSQPLSDELIRAKTLSVNNFMREVRIILRSSLNTCDNPFGSHGTLRRRRGRRDDGSEANACVDCATAYSAREELIREIDAGEKIPRRTSQLELLQELAAYEERVGDSAWAALEQQVFSTQLRFRCIPEFLSGEEEEEGREGKRLSEEDIGKYVSTRVSVVPAWRMIQEEALGEYSRMPFMERLNQFNWPEGAEMPDLSAINAFDVGHYNLAAGIDSSALTYSLPLRINWLQCDWLKAKLEDLSTIILTEVGSEGYRVGMVRRLQEKVMRILDDFGVYCERNLDCTFKWETHYLALLLFTARMKREQMEWNERQERPNNPLIVWAKLQEGAATEEEGDGVEKGVKEPPPTATAPSSFSTISMTGAAAKVHKRPGVGSWARR